MGQLRAWFTRKKPVISDQSENRHLDAGVKTFAVQYNGAFHLRSGRDYHIMDLFNYGVNDIGRVKAVGSIPVAYFSTQFEDFRPDSKQFKEEWLYGDLDGWEGELVLRPDFMDEYLPIMYRRIDLAVEKGFMAIDPDNTDSYYFFHGSQSKKDCAKLWSSVAGYARSKGLLVGLKNSSFLFSLGVKPDFCVTESIFKWNEAWAYKQFEVPILNTEYSKLHYDKSKADSSIHTLYKHKVRMDAEEFR